MPLKNRWALPLLREVLPIQFVHQATLQPLHAAAPTGVLDYPMVGTCLQENIICSSALELCRPNAHSLARTDATLNSAIQQSGRPIEQQARGRASLVLNSRGGVDA